MQPMNSERLETVVLPSRQTSLALKATVCVAATGLIALAAHIAVPLPFTPVPLSLATFAVILTGLLMGPQMGFATLALYLAEGAVGLPVFAPTGVGGVAQLFGPTGGYLLAYPLAGACAGFVAPLLRKVIPAFSAFVVAGVVAAVIYLGMGTSWLAALTHASLSHAIAMAVTPFLPGELAKVILAAGIATTVLHVRTRKA